MFICFIFFFFINYLLKIQLIIKKELVCLAHAAILVTELLSNTILNTVYSWFCENKLKLNLFKSYFIRFEIKFLNIQIIYLFICPFFEMCKQF